METWYEAYAAAWNKEKVSPVQVERSTAACVWIQGRRVKRITPAWRCYFPTSAEAWDHIEAKASTKVEHAKITLQRCRSELRQIQAERRKAESI